MPPPHPPLGTCAELPMESAPSGLYTGYFRLGSPIPLYCDMERAGGGWTLLLTLTSPADNFAGSAMPFGANLNADSPALDQPYARNWTSSGVGLLPLPADEFMILHNATGDFVR